MNKICENCYIEKNITEYSIKLSMKIDGHKNICKECEFVLNKKQDKVYKRIIKNKTQICTKCKLEKNINEFPVHRKKCSTCWKQKNKNIYDYNKKYNELNKNRFKIEKYC